MWPILIAVLAVATICFLIYPVSRLFSPLSFNYSEGWNAYWDEAARTGHALYASMPSRTIANYPPLAFRLVALASHATGGNVTIAGRLIALFCVLWSAVNVGVAAQHTTKSAGAAWLAGLCLLLWISIGTANRIGTNDPHFLALALSTVGMCAVMRAEHGRLWIVLAASFFATALFVKNAMLGFPIATALYLVSRRNWSGLAVFIVAGIAACAFWCALTLVVDGPFFFAHLLSTRSLDRMSGIASLSYMLNLFYAPLILGLIGLLLRTDRGAEYPALCFLCAITIDVFFVFGNGVTGNIFYEAMAGLAVVVAAAVDVIRRNAALMHRGAALATASALLAVASACIWAPGEVYAALGRMQRAPQRTADFIAGVDALRAAPGPALCESLLMCFEAGKPFVFDPYYVKDQIAVDRLSEAQVIDDLDQRRFGVVEIGEDDASFELSAGPRLRFTAGTMAALLSNYRVALSRPTFAILVPK